MTLKGNFRGGGGGVQFEKPSMGWVWIFSGTTQFVFCKSTRELPALSKSFCETTFCVLLASSRESKRLRTSN